MRYAVAILLALCAFAARAETLYGYAGGAAIQLEVGDVPVEVPDCTTSPTAQATCVSAVEGAGFVANVVSACSESVSSGDVIATQPPGGAEAEEGSVVVIRVSTGVACAKSRGSRLGFGLGVNR